MRKTLTLCVLSTLGLAAGCSDATTDAVATSGITVVNKVCPIMGSEVKPEELTPELTRDFNGKKVGFCCPPCLEEWDEMTDAEKTAKLEKPGDSHAH